MTHFIEARGSRHALHLPGEMPTTIAQAKKCLEQSGPVVTGAAALSLRKRERSFDAIPPDTTLNSSTSATWNPTQSPPQKPLAGSCSSMARMVTSNNVLEWSAALDDRLVIEELVSWTETRRPAL